MAALLGDLVGRDRRSDRVALRVPARDRSISYRNFCTTAWKAGHALSHLGVHAGSRVALTPDPAPQVLETLFGGALLGARLTFDPTAEARVVMGPVEREAELADGRRKVLVYGGPPDASTATHWEGVVWSENPSTPPGEHSPSDPVLDGDGRTFTHEALLTRARAVVTRLERDGTGGDTDGDRQVTVALRASLADPGVVVAGVLAPLLAGGTVVLPEDGTDATADVGVGEGAVPEPRRIDPSTV
jgi:acyl-CoA synthetase (AMP-forming)/AMP-acid ligase II